MPKKAVKVVDVSQEEIQGVNVYDKIKMLKSILEEKAQLEKIEKVLKEEINAYFENIPKDSFGNRYVETPDGLKLKREIRKKVAINEAKAKKFFKGIKRYADVAREEIIVTFNEDAIEQLIAEGAMTLEDLNSITDTKVSYATVFPKEVKEEEEI